MNLFVSHGRIVFRTFPWVFALQLEDKYNMEIPTQLVSLSRCLTMLEGMAMECNPDFQLVHSSFPFILEQLLRGAAQCITAHKLPISQTSFERLSLHTAQCLHVSMRWCDGVVCSQTNIMFAFKPSCSAIWNWGGSLPYLIQYLLALCWVEVQEDYFLHPVAWWSWCTSVCIHRLFAWAWWSAWSCLWSISTICPNHLQMKISIFVSLCAWETSNSKPWISIPCQWL